MYVHMSCCVWRKQITMTRQPIIIIIRQLKNCVNSQKNAYHIKMNVFLIMKKKAAEKCSQDKMWKI